MERSFLISGGTLEIPCEIYVPDHMPANQVILGVHGFSGSKKDMIQRAIAEEMGLYGSAMVRFDFPAHGESPMDSTYFTLPNCRESLLAAARWLREQFPEVEDLCIFATGFGAYITLLELEKLLELSGRLKLVVQTPAVLMHETLLAMKGMTAPTLQAMGKVTFRADRPFDVTYDFYCDLQENIALAAQPIPMLILCGEEDSYIRTEAIQNFRRLNETSKLVIIPGTSHRFLEDGAWDMVLDLTRDWFEFEQVLCCDWE